MNMTKLQEILSKIRYKDNGYFICYLASDRDEVLVRFSVDRPDVFTGEVSPLRSLWMYRGDILKNLTEQMII